MGRRLMAQPMAATFDLTRLRPALAPYRLHYFPTLRSTNDHAAVLRKRGDLYAPAVVLTARQTAGRGRGANTWQSPPGIITVTFVLPAEEHLAPHQIPLIAGLAVRAAAAELTGNGAIGLKWPNDVYHDGKKLAGILCERVHRADLVGIGLNVNPRRSAMPRALRERATALNAILGKPIDLTDALIAMAGHLRRLLDCRNDAPFGALLREYDRHHILVGHRISIQATPAEPPIIGRCDGLDEEGRLLLRDRSGLHHVIAGHVEML